MPNVPMTNVNAYYSNTSPGNTILSNVIDAAIQDIVQAINDNWAIYDAFVTNMTLPIPDQSIVERHIRNLAITNPKLAPSAVTNDKIADGTITAAKLADLLITTSKLADLSVANGKLVALSVTGDKIANSTITTDKLQDLLITTAKLAEQSVIETKLGTSSVSTRALADRSVTAGKLDPSLVAPISDAGIQYQFGLVNERLTDIMYNVKSFGAVGDGITDDTASIQSAIDYCSANGGGVVLIPTGTFLISGTGISVSESVSLVMDPNAKVLYSGSGTALTFNSSRNKNHTLGKIERITQDWKVGTDTTSVGIKIRNVNHSVFTILECFNFNIGIQLYGIVETGSFGGVAYNTITLGQITDNKIGLSFNKSNDGFTNGNTIIGGAIRINSNNAGISGSKLIDLSQDGNGNTFVGVNLEGSAQEKTVEIAASNNMFLNCRMELIPENSWHFKSSSRNNQVIGGYGNFGFDSKPQGDGKRIFFDEGTGNFIQGGTSLKLYGDNGTYGGTALVLEGLTSGSAIVQQVQNFLKHIFMETNAAGTVKFWPGLGKFDATTNPSGFVNPNIQITPSTSSIDTGNSDGSFVPTPLIKCFNGVRTDLVKQLNINGGAISCTSVTLTVNSTSPAVSTSNYFVTANTAATSIASFSSGLIGQVITIVFGDANTTIKNNANIKLTGSVDFVAGVNNTLSLIKTSSVWIETGRAVL